MRLSRIALAAAVLTGCVLSSARLSAADSSDDFRRSAGNLRPESRTAGGAIQGSPPPASSSSAQRYVPAPAVVYPYSPYSSGYYYPPGYGYPSPYYGYNYYRRPYGYRVPRYYGGYLYAPPVYLPSQRLFGPQAVKRFMGVGR